MRIVFAGTPAFVLPTLNVLFESEHRLVAIYTVPDRLAGRGLKKQKSPVKDFAIKRDIPLQQAAAFDDEACTTLAMYKADLMIVMAYGLILPSQALSALNLACVNSHLSLLPRWRGAAPVSRAIEAGDVSSGVCLTIITETLDTGPVIASRKIPLLSDETAESLYERLGNLSQQMVAEFLRNPKAMLENAIPQSQVGVCYASKLSKQEAWLDWKRIGSLSIME